ncbi:hypothetical protein GF312_06450 [Candidatus Poribacteria bacterium]|nr:hypothetical protein [Candidatus Poribacteria bacterium]
MKPKTNFKILFILISSLILIINYGINAQDADIKHEKSDVSEIDKYSSIINNNLFMPLGSGDEIKTVEFVLTGIMGNSAFIQIRGSDKSYYVTEGQRFAHDVKLIKVGKESVYIIHEGSEKEIKLPTSQLTSNNKGSEGGGNMQRQDSYKKGNKEKGSANSVKKESWDRGKKPEGEHEWARKMSVDELHNIRREIEKHIDGLQMKGIRNPEEYRGAMEKLEVVERAISNKN